MAGVVLGPEFAREVAARSGFGASHAGFSVLDDAAAAELGSHMEVQLRTTLELALRFARRARRGRKLRLLDVTDALSREGGDSSPVFAPGQAQAGSALVATQAMVARDIRLRATDRRPVWSVEEVLARQALLAPSPGGALPAHPPKLQIGWLAIRGQAVAPDLGPLLHSGSAVPPTSHPSRAGAPNDQLSALLIAPPELLDDNQISLLHKIVGVLEGGKDMAKRRILVPDLVRRVELSWMRPFLARYVSQRIPTRIASASPDELLSLITLLEGLALVNGGAELYLHQVMPALLIVCLSDAMGARYPSAASRQFKSVRRRAIGLVARIIAKFKDFIPELHGTTCRLLTNAFKSSPSLSVIAGSAKLAVVLGPQAVKEVVVAAFRDDGLAEHLSTQLDLSSAAQAPPPQQAGNTTSSNSGPPVGDNPLRPQSFGGTKRAASVAQTDPKRARVAWRRSFADREASRTEVFDALLGALAVLPADPTSSRDMAYLAEAIAAAFGAEPEPLIAACPESRRLRGSRLLAAPLRMPAR